MRYYIFEALLPQVVLRREHNCSARCSTISWASTRTLGGSDFLSHTKGISSQPLGFDGRHSDTVRSCWTTRRHIPKSKFLFLRQTPSLADVLFLSLTVLSLSLTLAITAVTIYTRSRPARGSTPGRDKSLLSSLKTPDRQCGPHSLLLSGYGGCFPRGQSGQGVKLTTHVVSVLRLVVEIYLCPPSQFAFMTCTWVTFYCVHFILSVSTTALSLSIERPSETAVNNGRKFQADARCQCDKTPCELNCRAQHLPVPIHLRLARPHSLFSHAFCLISQLTAMFPPDSIDLLLLVTECSLRGRDSCGICAGILFNVECEFGSDPV